MSDPTQAFSNCVQKTCPLLHKGKIFKCSTAGLLKQTLDYCNPVDKQSWEPYIDKGIGLDSSESEVADFLDNFGKPSHLCGQCPTSSFSKIDHIKFVKFNKKDLD
jgi:hypothetical protein